LTQDSISAGAQNKQNNFCSNDRTIVSTVQDNLISIKSGLVSVCRLGFAAQKVIVQDRSLSIFGW
jgi:hypothetical protein